MTPKRLVVVQDLPTQFDSPLYSYINNKREFELVVFYTTVDRLDISKIDDEIGLSPKWDHLTHSKYDARFENRGFALWRQIISIKPSHVIISGWFPRSHALLAILLRISGVKIGIRSDNTLQHTNLKGLRGKIKRIFMALWPGLFNAWHPVGTLSCEYLNKLSIVKRKIYYFPYAVDVAWFSTQADIYRNRNYELRQNLGLSIDDFIILGVMKWSDREDPLTLLDAFLEASTKVGNLKLIIVGDGPLRTEVLQRKIISPARIITPGYANYSELPMYYGISDLFVHPAKHEPYGVSVQEAMACGLPAIVSNQVGAAPDYIEPDKTGDVFPAGDIKCLARIIVNWSNRRTTSEKILPLEIKNKAENWSYQFTVTEWRRCLNLLL